MNGASAPFRGASIPFLFKAKNFCAPSKVIEIAEDYDDFLNKIEKSLNNSDKKMIEKRIEFASRHSWENRFDEIQNIITSHS